MKRIGCIVLALLLLLSGALLTSCGNDPAATPLQSNQQQTQEQVQDKYAAYGFADVDLENRPYCVLTLSGYNDAHYLVVSDESGTVLGDVAFRRTQYVNDVYNCDLMYWEGNPEMLINECISGGTHDFDLVYPHPTSKIVNMMISGYFNNLLACDTLRLEEPWWNQSQVTNYSVNNKLYLAVSDYSITGQGFAAMLYNKALFESGNFGLDLYETVKSGNWTMEQLHTLVKDFGGDTSGDGAINEKDTFGLAFQGGYAGRFMYAMDQFIFDYSGEQITLALKQESINSIAQKLYTLLWESDQRVFVEACNNAGWPTSNLWKIFSEDRALFMTYDVGGMFPLLSSLEQKPGYLPIPKRDTAQTDYVVICASGFLAIPACAESAENSGLVLDALSYVSYVDMRPAFFESILGGKMAEHPEDFEMLNLLHSKKVFDLGFTMDDGNYCRNLLQNLVVDGKNVNTSSYWRQNASFMNAVVSKLQSFPQ